MVPTPPEGPLESLDHQGQSRGRARAVANSCTESVEPVTHLHVRVAHVHGRRDPAECDLGLLTIHFVALFAPVATGGGRRDFEPYN